MRTTAYLSTVCLSLLLASCGGGGSEPVPSSVVVAEPSTTTSVVATTTAPTTTITTTTSTTTTTTIPPTPRELRDEFLASLDAAGWNTFTDELVGWSIRYPGDWDVIADEPGGLVIFVEPGRGGFLNVSPSLDTSDADESSDDYLSGNVAFAVFDGLVREPQEDDWFWLDTDFDGVQGPQDIVGVELNFAVDPFTGRAFDANEPAPTWWYGYYDPQTRPSYGYVMQTFVVCETVDDRGCPTDTFGTSPVVFENADDIYLSFEPPDGYPSLGKPAG